MRSFSLFFLFVLFVLGVFFMKAEPWPNAPFLQNLMRHIEPACASYLRRKNRSDLMSKFNMSSLTATGLSFFLFPFSFFFLLLSSFFFFLLLARAPSLITFPSFLRLLAILLEEYVLDSLEARPAKGGKATTTTKTKREKSDKK